MRLFIRGMEQHDQNINPDSWTEKELLKHLYREMKEVKIQQSQMLDEISMIKKELQNLSLNQIEITTKIETQEKEFDKRINRNNLIATVIGIIIAALSLFWK